MVKLIILWQYLIYKFLIKKNDQEVKSFMVSKLWLINKILSEPSFTRNIIPWLSFRYFPTVPWQANKTPFLLSALLTLQPNSDDTAVMKGKGKKVIMNISQKAKINLRWH